MGNDAISNTKKTETSHDSNSVSASPIIIILALLSIVGIVLFLFRDKIFKKKTQTLEDAKQEPEQEPEPTEPEPLKGDDAEQINDKFADLNNK